MSFRKSYEEVKKIFEDNNYILLSKEYKNNKIPLEFTCNKGHKGKISLADFYCSGKRCRQCSNESKRTDFSKIKKFFESKGCTLLSVESDYKKNTSKLEYVCSRDHKNVTTWVRFYNGGSGCRKCAELESRLDVEVVKKTLKEKGYTLLQDLEFGSITYSTKIFVQCPNCSNKYKTTYGTIVSSGNWCRKCFPESYSIKRDFVVNFLSKEGYILLSEFTGSRDYFEYKCPNGHKNKMLWTNFFSGSRRCPDCNRGGVVSKVSQKWLDSLGIQEREFCIPELSFRVDGFDSKTNTVYEFLGDYWHGNPENKKCVGVNRRSGASFEELRNRTFQRFEKIKQAGYNVVYIWEKDFREGNQTLQYFEICL